MRPPISPAAFGAAIFDQGELPYQMNGLSPDWDINDEAYDLLQHIDNPSPRLISLRKTADRHIEAILDFGSRRIVLRGLVTPLRRSEEGLRVRSDVTMLIGWDVGEVWLALGGRKLVTVTREVPAAGS